jgi:hypothetical protein
MRGISDRRTGEYYILERKMIEYKTGRQQNIA